MSNSRGRPVLIVASAGGVPETFLIYRSVWIRGGRRLQVSDQSHARRVGAVLRRARCRIGPLVVGRAACPAGRRCRADLLAAPSSLESKMSDTVHRAPGSKGRRGRKSVMASRFATGVLMVALAVGSAAAARWVVSPAPGHVVIAPTVSINQNLHPGATPPAASPVPSGGSVVAGDARSALAALPVKGPAPLTGYSRAAFGPAWADVDRSGCDQRNQVLARDMTAVQLRKGSRCVVAFGRLLDPYTGKQINFVRGQGTSEAVQIDHVVALADAWRTGAQQLDQHTRAQMAGDLVELLAVDGPTNQAKRDRDAAAWLPANKAYRCNYVARQVAVKIKYRLWVIPAERDAIDRILAGCPIQPLPTT